MPLEGTLTCSLDKIYNLTGDRSYSNGCGLQFASRLNQPVTGKDDIAATDKFITPLDTTTSNSSVFSFPALANR